MPMTHPQTLQLLLLPFILLPARPPVCHAIGYSYTRFSGPVSGPEQKIFVRDAPNDTAGRVDYIAKPTYEFAYGVEDGAAQLLQNRHETRDGHVVRGSYSVLDPDGKLRTVSYSADPINGYQAHITTTHNLAEAVHAQQPQYQYPAPLGTWQPQPPYSGGYEVKEETHPNYETSSKNVQDSSTAPRRPHPNKKHEDNDHEDEDDKNDDDGSDGDNDEEDVEDYDEDEENDDENSSDNEQEY